MQTPHRKNHDPQFGCVGGYNPNTISHHRVVDFNNMTPFKIVVVDRNSVPVLLPEAPSGTDMRFPGVEIRICYRFYGHVGYRSMIEILESLGNVLKDRNEERAKITEMMIEVNGKNIPGFEIVIRRFISQQELQEYKAIYDVGTDYMVCVGNSYLTFAHPESREGRNNKDIDGYVKGRPNGRLIEIVDNNKEIKERFMFCTNSVIRVPVIQDVERDNGIYVTNIRDNGMSTSDIDTVRYSFEEGSEKFGLFLTKEDALTSGNPDRISKVLVAERERELQELKAVLSKQELEFDKERAERRVEIERLNDEIAKKSVERKDYYEEKSAERKDSSELIKIASAVVAGFAAAALLFFKR